MASILKFRERAVAKLTKKAGVYVLCDLNKIPIYVGQSREGIRGRVRRHLTSARSDIIANRQLDVWEVAYVWTYPVDDKSQIAPLEASLYHYFNDKSQLINGSVPARSGKPRKAPEPSERVQVLPDEEIEQRSDPVRRLPRQAGHYAAIVGHFLEVKESKEIGRALEAHFERLQRYHRQLLAVARNARDEKTDDG